MQETKGNQGESKEIGGNRWWFGGNRSFYYFLNIVFVAPEGLESGGEFPFINLKEGKMGVGCVGGGGEGGGRAICGWARNNTRNNIAATHV